MLLKPVSPRLQVGNPLAQVLVLGMPFYEGSGPTVNDLSGYGNNGTLNGGATWVGGQNGWCLSFDGSSGYVNTGSYASQSIGYGQFFASCWFNQSGFNASSPYLGNSSLIAYGADYPTINSYQLLTNGTDASHIYVTFQFTYEIGETISVSSSPLAISLNTWYHVCAFYGGGNLNLFINGQLVNSNLQNSIGLDTTTSMYQCWLGSQNRTTYNFPLAGMIDSPIIGALPPNVYAIPSGVMQNIASMLYQDSFVMYRRRGVAWKSGGGGTNYTRTATDAPTTSDAIARFLASIRSATSLPATSDTATRIGTFQRSVTDNPQTSDTITRSLAFVRTLSDAPTTTDTATRLQVLARSPTDTPATTDTGARTGTFPRSVTDSPLTSDTASRAQVLNRTLTAIPTTIDTATRLQVLARTGTDTPATSDTATASILVSRTAADSPATTDTASRILVLARTAADSPATADTITRLQVLARSLTDNPATTDTAIASILITRNAADSPATADSASRTLALVRSLADAPATTDSASRLQVLVRSASDSPLTSDVAARVQALVRIVSASPATTDAVTRAFVGARELVDAPTTSDAAVAVKHSGGGGTTGAYYFRLYILSRRG